MLLHAITDSLLGAACAGDIGELFPDTAAENKGLDSALMLAAARDRIADLGWQISNVDCVVLAERPKLIPHKPRMQARIADILGIQSDQVGLKGKTGEGTGEIGRGQIMQALASCLIYR